MKTEPITAKDIQTSKINVEGERIQVGSRMHLVATMLVDKETAARYPQAIEDAERKTREMVVRRIYQSVRDDARVAFEELRRCVGIHDAETLRRVMEPLLSAGASAV